MSEEAGVSQFANAFSMDDLPPEDGEDDAALSGEGTGGGGDDGESSDDDDPEKMEAKIKAKAAEREKKKQEEKDKAEKEKRLKEEEEERERQRKEMLAKYGAAEEPSPAASEPPAQTTDFNTTLQSEGDTVLQGTQPVNTAALNLTGSMESSQAASTPGLRDDDSEYTQSPVRAPPDSPGPPPPPDSPVTPGQTLNSRTQMSATNVSPPPGPPPIQSYDQPDEDETKYADILRSSMTLDNDKPLQFTARTLMHVPTRQPDQKGVEASDLEARVEEFRTYRLPLPVFEQAALPTDHGLHSPPRVPRSPMRNEMSMIQRGRPSGPPEVPRTPDAERRLRSELEKAHAELRALHSEMNASKSLEVIDEAVKLRVAELSEARVKLVECRGALSKAWNALAKDQGGGSLQRSTGLLTSSNGGQAFTDASPGLSSLRQARSKVEAALKIQTKVLAPDVLSASEVSFRDQEGRLVKFRVRVKEVKKMDFCVEDETVLANITGIKNEGGTLQIDGTPRAGQGEKQTTTPASSEHANRVVTFYGKLGKSAAEKEDGQDAGEQKTELEKTIKELEEKLLDNKIEVGYKQQYEDLKREFDELNKNFNRQALGTAAAEAAGRPELEASSKISSGAFQQQLAAEKTAAEMRDALLQEREEKRQTLMELESRVKDLDDVNRQLVTELNEGRLQARDEIEHALQEVCSSTPMLRLLTTFISARSGYR